MRDRKISVGESIVDAKSRVFLETNHEEKNEKLKALFFTINDQMNWEQFEWNLKKALKRLKKAHHRFTRWRCSIVVLWSHYTIRG